MAFDYSASFAGINNAISNIGKQNELAYQRQTLANLGQKIQGGDYAGAAQAAFAAGDASTGLGLLKLGQTQKQLEGQNAISTLFAGGGAPGQTIAGLGQRSAYTPTPVAPRPVQVAETEGDTQRLEAEMARNAQIGYGNASLPAGMRNNNPGNIKFVQGMQGVIGPSQNTDQGDPQAVFASPEQGMQAAYNLAMRKYSGGKRTANDLIAGNMGWTPGNMQAAANIARTMGIRPDEDLRLDDPARAQAFMRALLLQEHGKASLGYSDQMIAAAVGGNRQPAQGAPVQVAQAAPQPGAPMADTVAPGAVPVTGPATTQAAQAQGFAIPGTSLPPNDPFPKVTTQQLYGIAMSPLASDGQRQQVRDIIAARQKYSDENAPDKREMTRLQTQKLRQEVEGEGARPMTPDERKSYNVPDGQAAYIKRNGDPGFGPAGTKIVNEAQKGETKFEEAMGTAQAKRWNGYIEEGDKAQTRLADIQTLRDASRRLGSQGSTANLKSLIGPYAESLGINVDGLSDIQLYESITNRLAPQLHAPSSGSTSDIEFKGFMKGIGPLSNNPAAREMIFDTFEAASRNDVARSQIASRLASKEIDRGQAERELRALPDPMTAFREFRKQNPDVVGQAIKESARIDHEQRKGPQRVQSIDDATKLPSGTEFIDPNGVRRRVP